MFGHPLGADDIVLVRPAHHRSWPVLPWFESVFDKELPTDAKAIW